MPRIRTIKPEFFTSPDTARVSFEVRIFYQALWCWADDFGIGETNINGLLGFAFCDEDEISAPDVRRFCADVAQHYGVIFYTVRGRHYYAIPSWDKHQKTERRTERRRHPAPDDPESAPDKRFYPCAESAPEMRRGNGADSRKSSAGTGEQGNRGTGEQGNPNPTDSGDLEVAAHTGQIEQSGTTQTLIAEWIEHCQRRPPGQVIGQISKLTKQLLDDDQIPYEDVRHGLASWQQKGLHPSALPSVINEVINARPAASRQQNNTNDLFDRALARAAQREQEAS